MDQPVNLNMEIPSYQFGDELPLYDVREEQIQADIVCSGMSHSETLATTMPVPLAMSDFKEYFR